MEIDLTKNISELITMIDEDDLEINEIPIFEYEKNKIIDYTGTYYEMTIIFRVFQDKKQLLDELRTRIKQQSKFLPYTYGICCHSEFGCGIILQFISGQDLSSILNTEYNNKKEIIVELLNMYLFFNSRGFYFPNLSLNMIFYTSNGIVLNEFPIDSELNENEDYNSILYPPQYISNDILSLQSWRLGLIIFEFISEKKLEYLVHDNKDNLSIIKSINSLNIGNNLKNLMKKLLKQKNEFRITTIQLLPYIKSFKNELETTFNLTEIQVNSNQIKDDNFNYNNFSKSAIKQQNDLKIDEENESLVKRFPEEESKLKSFEQIALKDKSESEFFEEETVREQDNQKEIINEKIESDALVLNTTSINNNLLDLELHI